MLSFKSGDLPYLKYVQPRGIGLVQIRIDVLYLFYLHAIGGMEVFLCRE